MSIVDVARRLVSSHQLAPSTVRLQPGSFTRPGSYSNTRTNTRERRISVTFRAANSAVVVYHGLGFPPSGYTPLTTSAACRLYNDTPLRSTSRVLVLKCDTANITADILVR